MRTLIVGGAGYIGSIVASHLIEAGHEVTVADNLSKGHEWAVPEAARFVKVDVLDAAGVAETVAVGFDAVLHFAALSLVGESVAEPARYFRTNVAGSLNLLDAVRASGVERLVFSSTAAVYGDPEEVPITEDAPTRPTNPYGASKLAVDHAIGFECAATGLGAVSLRYFNVAGASGGLGELHDPETHLIPLVLRAAAGERPDIAVYGTDYPTADGTAIRDYIHVDDLARAHLLALDAAAAPGHRIYNLGNGAGFSVREVIEVARSVTGCEIPAVEADRRPGDPAVLVASSDRIRADLGWVPEKPDLATMIGDAWAFTTTHRR
jgi:UDP-glucose 4-epimerase